MLKNSFFSLLLILSGIIVLNTRVFAVNPKFELNTSEATLTIDQKGNLKIGQAKGLPFRVTTVMTRLWKITLKNTQDGKETILIPDAASEWIQSGQTMTQVTDHFIVGNHPVPVKAEFSISVKDDAFCFSGKIKSESKDWIIKDFTWPDLSGIRINDKNVSIYWPNSLGECFTNPREFGSRSFEYPGTKGSMAWFSVNSPEHGIYIGCHDPQRGSKMFKLAHSETDDSFNTSVTFPVYCGDFSIPDVMIKIYRGSWHVGSKFYRDFFDRNFKLAEISQWTKENAGLMLIIFKHQLGNVMWRYNEIDQLCDIGERLNIKLIGLWGWGVSGHDRLHPVFVPDNLMGGRQELEKAIERAHKRGFKVIVYSSGTVIDASTEYYLFIGIETITLNERKQPDIEFYIKYRNTTPVIWARTCCGSALWRKTMMDIALDARSLGVDAFYIDQVTVRGPVMCFSDKHDHRLPQEAYTIYSVKMMQDIRNRMKEIDPQFSIVTEGTVDALLTDIDAFHGLGPGSIITPNAFPAMFRYTFPESIIIQLNSCPALSRFDANYAAVYGLRHEIMCRYEPDVDYLKTGKIPSPESYNYYSVISPPVLSKMTDTKAGEVTSYTHKLIQFENENNIFFRNGKFIDQDGIDVTGDDILAKAFINGKKMGVVVWNKNLSEKRSFSLTVKDYHMIKASEPGITEVTASAPLDVNSLRLLVFEKN